MGLQSAIVRGIGVVGLATTALTSPLAMLMTELAKGLDFRTHATLRTAGITGSPMKPRVIGWLATVLLIYGLAAFVGGIALIHVPAETGFLPLFALLPVILGTFKDKRSHKVHISTTSEGTEGRS